jgi:hypothetical protein
VDDLTDYMVIAKDLRKRRRAWEAEKRRTEKAMARIRVDMERLYPDPSLVDALALLMDEDQPWFGDFDLMREPLAELLLKLHACGVMQDDVERLTDVILYVPDHQ